jgi:hypothetical protein
MIETAEIRYFACMWFVPNTSRGDYMALLYQKHDESWEMKYRFRYYTSSSPDGADDEKHWYVMNFKDDPHSPEEIEENFEAIVSLLFRSRYSLKSNKIDIRGDATKFVEVMAKQSWVHIRTSSSTDAPS